MYFVPEIELENPIYICWWVLRPIAILLSCHTSCLVSFYWENIQKCLNKANIIKNSIHAAYKVSILHVLQNFHVLQKCWWLHCKTVLSFSRNLMIKSLCFSLENQWLITLCRALSFDTVVSLTSKTVESNY